MRGETLIALRPTRTAMSLWAAAAEAWEKTLTNGCEERLEAHPAHFLTRSKDFALNWAPFEALFLTAEQRLGCSCGSEHEHLGSGDIDLAHELTNKGPPLTPFWLPRAQHPRPEPSAKTQRRRRAGEVFGKHPQRRPLHFAASAVGVGRGKGDAESSFGVALERQLRKAM